MDLVFVGKVAKENNGVKYFLVRQGSDRTVDAKGMKTKDSKETLKAVSTMITETFVPRKFELTKRQSLLEFLKALPGLRRRNLLSRELDQSCICRRYNTIPGK